MKSVKRFIVLFAMACLFSMQAIEANRKRLKGRNGFWSHYQYRELQQARKGGKDDDDAWNSGDGSPTVVEVSVSQSKHDAYVKQHKHAPSLPPQDISASLLTKKNDSKPNNVNAKNSSPKPPSNLPQPPPPSKPAKGSGSSNKGASNTKGGVSKGASTQKTSGSQGVPVSKNKNSDPKGTSVATSSNPKGLKGYTVPNAGGTKGAKGPTVKKTKDGDGKGGKTTKMDSSGTNGGNNGVSATTGTSSVSNGNGNGKTPSLGSNGPDIVAPPRVGFQTNDGRPLTGVPVTRFSLLYTINHSLGIPTTSEYEAAHDKTFNWLYTIMSNFYGNKLKNLLTDDTNNTYSKNAPIDIEYTSVALFDAQDTDIPSKQELDQLVLEAFSGNNLQSYVNSLHNLPSTNPFSSTTNVKLVRSTTNTGKNGGSLRSAKGLLPPLVAAATLFIVLAGGAVLYKRRQANNEEKGIDNLSPFGEETTMNDCTVSLTSTSPDKRGTNMSKEGLAGELLLQEEKYSSTPPLSQKHAHELAGWNEFVEREEAGTRPSPNQKPEENSQYSIEDFVKEAEHSLLGVSIRYPDSSSISRQSSPEEDAQDSETTSTRLSV